MNNLQNTIKKTWEEPVLSSIKLNTGNSASSVEMQVYDIHS